MSRFRAQLIKQWQADQRKIEKIAVQTKKKKRSSRIVPS